MGALKRIGRSALPFVLALPVLYGIQLVAPDGWVPVLVNMGVAVTLAASLNVVNGFTGQFSLGHAGFMAVGAYTAAKIMVVFHGGAVPDEPLFFLALLAGMATAAIAGFAVGMPSLRLRGDYLAIVTLGFGEIIRNAIENMRSLGGATGMSGLPKMTTIAWAGMGAVATVVMSRRLVGSTHGRALLAIREDEIAAEAMGVDTTGYKVRAFVISSAFAGLGGGLLVHFLQLATPRTFTFVKSIEIVAMVVLGGMGSVTGSVVAALVLTALPELLRSVDQYRMVIYSLLLIVLMLTRPGGIFGTRELWDLWPARLGRRKGKAGPAPQAEAKP